MIKKLLIGLCAMAIFSLGIVNVSQAHRHHHHHHHAK